MHSAAEDAAALEEQQHLDRLQEHYFASMQAQQGFTTDVRLFHNIVVALATAHTSCVIPAPRAMPHVWAGGTLAHRLPPRSSQRAPAPPAPANPICSDRCRPMPRPTASAPAPPRTACNLSQRPGCQVYSLPRGVYHAVFECGKRRRGLGVWLSQPPNARVLPVKGPPGAKMMMNLFWSGTHARYRYF